MILPKTIRDALDRDKPQPDPKCPWCRGTGVLREDTHLTDNGPGATRYITQRCDCVR